MTHEQIGCWEPRIISSPFLQRSGVDDVPFFHLVSFMYISRNKCEKDSLLFLLGMGPLKNTDEHYLNYYKRWREWCRNYQILMMSDYLKRQNFRSRGGGRVGSSTITTTHLSWRDFAPQQS